MPGFETGCLLTMLVSTPHAASGSQGHRPCEVLRSIIRMPAFWLAVLTALCPASRAADFDGATREDRHQAT